MKTDNRSFEIYYYEGGHCGPYYTLFGAVIDAARKLRGCRYSYRTVVRDRAIADPKQSSILVLEKQKDGSIIIAPPNGSFHRHLLVKRKETA